MRALKVRYRKVVIEARQQSDDFAVHFEVEENTRVTYATGDLLCFVKEDGSYKTYQVVGQPMHREVAPDQLPEATGGQVWFDLVVFVNAIPTRIYPRTV